AGLLLGVVLVAQDLGQIEEVNLAVEVGVPRQYRPDERLSSSERRAVLQLDASVLCGLVAAVGVRDAVGEGVIFRHAAGQARAGPIGIARAVEGAGQVALDR